MFQEKTRQGCLAYLPGADYSDNTMASQELEQRFYFPPPVYHAKMLP